MRPMSETNYMSALQELIDFEEICLRLTAAGFKLESTTVNDEISSSLLRAKLNHEQHGYFDLAAPLDWVYADVPLRLYRIRDALEKVTGRMHADLIPLSDGEVQLALLLKAARSHSGLRLQEPEQRSALAA